MRARTRTVAQPARVRDAESIERLARIARGPRQHGRVGGTQRDETGRVDERQETDDGEEPELEFRTAEFDLA